MRALKEVLLFIVASYNSLTRAICIICRVAKCNFCTQANSEKNFLSSFICLEFPFFTMLFNTDIYARSVTFCKSSLLRCTTI